MVGALARRAVARRGGRRTAGAKGITRRVGEGARVDWDVPWRIPRPATRSNMPLASAGNHSFSKVISNEYYSLPLDAEWGRYWMLPPLKKGGWGDFRRLR